MLAQSIMVMEDSDDDFETVKDAAVRSKLQQTIVRAAHGDECLSLLRKAIQGRNEQPLFLLLDLNTPNDDGRVVLREIRADVALKTLPVVVLSGSSSPRDIEFCYSIGANAYHVKPVDHALHLYMLQSIFGYWLSSVALPNRLNSAEPDG